MKVVALQSNLHWQNVAANKKHFKQLIQNITDADIIVLPEMFLSGFVTNNPDVAVSYQEAKNYLSELHSISNSAVCASVLVKEDGKCFNRFIWVDDTQVVHYDKKHLFSFANEQAGITAGDSQLIISYKNWRIAAFVCYDLRFPVWSRNKADNPYELALYVANWPEVRINAWSTLLKACAIENQCFVVGVNRVGEDGNGIVYNGASAMISPYGEIIKDNAKGQEIALEATLDLKVLQEFRKKFPVLNDGDGFSLR